jgi:hypothetical protein
MIPSDLDSPDTALTEILAAGEWETSQILADILFPRCWIFWMIEYSTIFGRMAAIVSAARTIIDE